MGARKRRAGSILANSLVLLQYRKYKRLTDLLLAGANALGVEVPVGVEIADGHPQVLHGDHGAVGQIWEEGRQAVSWHGASGGP